MYRRLVNVAAGLWIGVAYVLRCLGLKATPDPWRYSAALNLRSEAGKMMGGGFGMKDCVEDWTLDPEAAHEQFAKRLRNFLSGEPLARIAVQDTVHITRTVPIKSVDVSMAKFAQTGALLELSPVLDPEVDPALDSTRREAVHRSLIEAANATLAYDVTERTGMILERIRLSHSAAESAYALRILQGSFVTFEKTGDRFCPPDPLVFRFPGAAMLNFVIRELPGGKADFWMQSQHSVIDGVEIGILSKRLDQAFGGSGQIKFPAADGGAKRTLPCKPVGGRDLVLISDFFDFTQLRLLRRNLNQNFAGHLPVPVTEASLLLWALGNQPEFAGETFALTVDLSPDKKNAGRRIDFVVIRPWEFFDSSASLDGFPAFLAAYAERFRLVQAGRSRTYRTLKRLTLLPPFLAKKVTSMNVRARQRGFGTITLTLMKPVAVTLAPISSLASDRGTFAIGSMLLPSESGGSVGWVTIKGPPDFVAGYPDALHRALSKFTDSLQAYA